MSTKQFTITEEEKNKRIDQYLQQHLTELSRTQIQNLIKNEQVLVNSTKIKKNYRLEFDDRIEVLEQTAQVTHNLDPIPGKLKIVYEDDNIAVIDKPPYLAVHPDQKFSHPKTLINLLLGNNIPLSTLGGKLRPGIVHRLDMDTSGLIVIAKTDLGYKTMRDRFEEHQISKKYLCLCVGQLESEKGLIKAPITRNPLDRKKMSVQATQNAKNALSQFKVLKKIHWKETDKILSLVEVKILTGRTHQIRVHFSAINHPLLGDTTYGNSKLNASAHKIGLKRQFLHACELKFYNTDQTPLSLESELPHDLQEFLDKIS